jgi:hypothetical protein
MPTRAGFWWAARWINAVTGGSPDRFTDGRLWVRSVRGRMAPRGVERPRRAVRVASGGDLQLAWLPLTVMGRCSLLTREEGDGL